MPNRPEYFAIWLGITGAGGAVALLNTNLSGPSLAHCIDLVAPKHVLVAATRRSALLRAEPHLATKPKIWMHGESAGEKLPLPRIDRAVEAFPGRALLAAERPVLTTEARARFIYT